MTRSTDDFRDEFKSQHQSRAKILHKLNTRLSSLKTQIDDLMLDVREFGDISRDIGNQEAKLEAAEEKAEKGKRSRATN